MRTCWGKKSWVGEQQNKVTAGLGTNIRVALLLLLTKFTAQCKRQPRCPVQELENYIEEQSREPAEREVPLCPRWERRKA